MPPGIYPWRTSSRWPPSLWASGSSGCQWFHVQMSFVVASLYRHTYWLMARASLSRGLGKVVWITQPFYSVTCAITLLGVLWKKEKNLFKQNWLDWNDWLEFLSILGSLIFRWATLKLCDLQSLTSLLLFPYYLGSVWMKYIIKTLNKYLSF